MLLQTYNTIDGPTKGPFFIPSFLIRSGYAAHLFRGLVWTNNFIIIAKDGTAEKVSKWFFFERLILSETKVKKKMGKGGMKARAGYRTGAEATEFVRFGGLE